MSERNLMNEEEYDSDLDFEINDNFTDTEDFIEDMEDTDSELEASENEDEEVYTSNHGFQFHDSEVSSHEEKKPEIIMFYNKTKGAVDTGDKMTSEYSCARSTRRWPFRVFMEMLDIAALNAYLLRAQKYPEWKANNRSRRKLFIRELSLELAMPNIVRRKKSTVKFHKQQQDAIDIAV
ncbi:uncharacterized protein LOC143915190 [Arctopsyche grandis]|uniref:uncharacterized protein LOC143915190 n=1 Tax=Arctopsyche grandis TaxID=121162 RepID=UPI00406D9E30